MRESDLAFVRSLFEDKIPFNGLLGLEIASLEPERPVIRFAHREDLVGNFTRGILHGGVISASLDTVGGLAAYLRVVERHSDEPPEQLRQRLAKIGTIDLRIDYLRTGKGREFRASAHLLRTGSRVAVTRMELHNDSDLLIAVGTGTYIVG